MSSDSQLDKEQKSTARLVINNIQEMTDFLEQLQESASNSIEEAVTAQLLVIKYIQAPTLVDTTFDTLLTCLSKALKYTQDDKEQERLREQFQLMIQNFIFFFDAKLRLKENQFDASTKELFEQAGEMLSKSIVSIANTVAASSGNPEAISRIIVKNIFKDEEQGNKIASLFKKLISQYIRKQEIINQKIDFAKELSSMQTL